MLSPLGIALPRIFKSGDAWGEWSASTLEKLIGYLPEGLKKHSGLWIAPVRNYNLGGEDADTATQAISYFFSGFLGLLAVVIIVYVVAKMFVRHER